jgi:hypothetical protein
MDTRPFGVVTPLEDDVLLQLESDGETWELDTWEQIYSKHTRGWSGSHDLTAQGLLCSLPIGWGAE